MKKILVGLFFTMFAFQVNAASITNAQLTLGENSISGGSFTNLFSTGVGEIQGIANVTGDFSISYDLSVAPSTGIRNVTVENPDENITITSVIITDSASATIASAIFDGTGSWNMSAYLFNTTTYTLTILGGLAGNFGGSVTTTVSAVPLPAAVWLFGSALVGLFGASRRKSSAMAA